MKERQLRIWKSYEPNRLATNYLSDAYGKLIMSTKYYINFKKKVHFDLSKKVGKK